MRPTLKFPVEKPAWGDERLELTFETIAVPPRPEIVSLVFGWVFHGNEVLLVRPKGAGWQLPDGRRQRGETFRETWDRTTWEQAGALLTSARMIGALRVTDGEPSEQPDTAAGPVEYRVCFLAEAREIVPFCDAFEAEDRMLIEPELLPRVVEQWSPLMDEMLAYALAVRTPALDRVMA